MSKRPALFSNRSKPRQYLTLGVIVVLAASAVWNNAQEDGGEGLAVNTAKGEYLLEVQVRQVIDGDTFNAQANGTTHRVRMASIDAPEQHRNSDQPGQPFAQASREHLASLIAGQHVNLRCFEQDNYGRDVCDVHTTGGATVNEQMVAAGYAWANTEKQGKFLRDGNLVNVQQDARAQKRGLWERTDAKAPWVWRYDCWQQGKC